MNNSYWMDSIAFPSFAKLEQDIGVDVCIVGGGITGITTAYYLAKNGYDVCLLEKDQLASHATRQYNC